MKKVLVLGGSRFIGFHLLKRLFEEDCSITVFNRGVTKPPEAFPPNIKIVNGARDNYDDIKGLFSEYFDYVFDISGLTYSQVEPIVNQFNANIGHYIFCSTTHVHKFPVPVLFDETAGRFFTERTYGGEKALAEDLLLKKYIKTGWPVTIFRPHYILGPYSGLILNYIFCRLIRSKPIPIRENNISKLNPLYVNDLVNSFISVIDNENSHGAIYGVGGDEIVNQTEFINLCGEIAGKTPVIVPMQQSKYKGMSGGLKWPQNDLVVNTQKIKEELNIEFTPLKTFLSETYKWINANPGGLEYKPFRGEGFIVRNKDIPVTAKLLWRVRDIMHI
jgi:dTDP-glucose 4,6-dehydratase